MSRAGHLFDANESAGWIEVEGWEKFQHYGKSRTPIWIKTYLDLLDKDEYLELSGATRSVLHGLWLLTAKRRGTVRADTTKLSRTLHLKVSVRQLHALRDAGFISFSASNPASKPASKVASVETETDKEVEEEITKGSPTAELVLPKLPDSQIAQSNGLDLDALAESLSGRDEGTAYVLKALRRRLPEAAFHNALDALETRKRNTDKAPLVSEAKFVVKTLQNMVEDELYGSREAV